jgi:hypothetical protein
MGGIFAGPCIFQKMIFKTFSEEAPSPHKESISKPTAAVYR